MLHENLQCCLCALASGRTEACSASPQYLIMPILLSAPPPLNKLFDGLTWAAESGEVPLMSLALASQLNVKNFVCIPSRTIF